MTSTAERKIIEEEYFSISKINTALTQDSFQIVNCVQFYPRLVIIDRVQGVREINQILICLTFLR